MLLAAFAWGRSKAAEEKRKIAVLAEFSSFVKFVGENIERFKTPLPDILAEYTPAEPKISEFITQAKSCGIKKSWENCSDMLGFSAESEKIAKKFVYSIGKGYTDEEVELCKYTSDSIDKILVKLKSDMADRVKMYYSLPLLFVSSVILIFL